MKYMLSAPIFHPPQPAHKQAAHTHALLTAFHHPHAWWQHANWVHTPKPMLVTLQTSQLCQLFTPCCLNHFLTPLVGYNRPRKRKANDWHFRLKKRTKMGWFFREERSTESEEEEEKKKNRKKREKEKLVVFFLSLFFFIWKVMLNFLSASDVTVWSEDMCGSVFRLFDWWWLPV